MFKENSLKGGWFKEMGEWVVHGERNNVWKGSVVTVVYFLTNKLNMYSR